MRGTSSLRARHRKRLLGSIKGHNKVLGLETAVYLSRVERVGEYRTKYAWHVAATIDNQDILKNSATFDLKAYPDAVCLDTIADHQELVSHTRPLVTIAYVNQGFADSLWTARWDYLLSQGFHVMLRVSVSDDMSGQAAQQLIRKWQLMRQFDWIVSPEQHPGPRGGDGRGWLHHALRAGRAPQVGPPTAPTRSGSHRASPIDSMRSSTSTFLAIQRCGEARST